MTEIRKITTANEAALPANIVLANTPDFKKMLQTADQLLRMAPINTVVNNYFAESPETKDLRDYLKILCDKNMLPAVSRIRQTHPGSFHDMLGSYFNGFAKVPRRLQSKEHVENLKSIFNTFMEGIVPFCSGTLTRFEIRVEKTDNAYDFHLDGGNSCVDKNWEQQAFYGQPVRILFHLANQGTVFADTTKMKKKKWNGTHHMARKPGIYMKPEGLQPGFYTYDAAHGSILWKPDMWQAKPLSCSVITGNNWTHIPSVHSWPKRKRCRARPRALALVYLRYRQGI